MTITIPLSWPKPPLVQNDRRHWTAQARAFAQAKDEARWAIRAAKVTPIVGAEVTLHYRLPDKRRRDADGPAPTLKVVLDALVAEGVLTDDSWVEVPSCRIQIHPPGGHAAMWVELTNVTHYAEQP